jgi:hypothetical protein
MHFDRFGCTYHLRVRTAEDLEQVLGLDDALWMATSAPVSGLNCEAEFLDFVDLDDNARIRADEVRMAVKWLLDRISDPSGLGKGTDELPLNAIEEGRPEGRQLAETARYILRNLGADSAGSVCIENIADFQRQLDSCPINGDGVITPDAPGDDQTRRFIEDVMACFGATDDLTGSAGITEELLDRFLTAARDHLVWRAAAELPEGEQQTALMPLGEATPQAREALEVVERKVDGFFARCRVLSFNARAAARIGIGAHEVEEADLSDPASIDAALARAPLAEPTADGLLPLDGKVNPVFRDALRQFRRRAAEPLLGAPVESLTEDQWEVIKTKLAPHREWLAARKGAKVESLGPDRLRECLDGPFEQTVRGMLAADREVAERLEQARQLRRLLLYHKLLMPLVNNFVSFPDLYDPGRRALFEMGALVIDGRWFEFAVRVQDLQRHSELSRTSGMFVMYVELTRVGEEDKTVVAVPATSGAKGNLCVGKRGIFYDTRGRHYDARVVQIIENPISFREALLSPFVRLGRFVAGKIESISGSAQKALETQLGKVSQGLETGVQEAVRQPTSLAQAPPQDAAATAAQASASRRDLLIGASVSVAALSSAFAFVTSAFAKLTPLKVLYGLVVIAVVVCVPTALVAGFKLARRDLSALLEGCGWAVNARMRLDRRQRRMFTRQPLYPPQASGTPRERWVGVLISVALLGVIAVCVLVVLRCFSVL